MTSSQQKMDAFADDTDPRIVYGGPWKSVKNLDTTSPPQDLLGSSSPLFGTLHTLDAADVVGQGTPLTLAFTYSGNAFKALFHMSETSGISSCTLDNMTQPISTNDSLTGKVSCSGGTSARMGLHSLVITFNPAPTARVQFDGIFYTPDDPGDPEENIVAYYNGTGLVGYGGLLSLDMTIPPGFSIGIYVDYTFSPDNIAPAQLSYTVGDFEAPVHFSTTNPCNSTNPTILSQLLIQAPRTQENFTDFHLAYYSPFAVYAVNQTKFKVSFMIVQNTPVPGTQLQIVPPLSSSTSSSSTSTSSSMTTISTPIMSTVPPTSGPVTHSKSHAIAIGAGTGAAIIALLFAGSIFYLWRRRMAAAESRLVVTDNSAWPRPYYPKRDETAQIPSSKGRDGNATTERAAQPLATRATEEVQSLPHRSPPQILYRTHEDGGVLMEEHESGPQQDQIVVDLPPSYENLQQNRQHTTTTLAPLSPLRRSDGGQRERIESTSRPRAPTTSPAKGRR